MRRAVGSTRTRAHPGCSRDRVARAHVVRATRPTRVERSTRPGCVTNIAAKEAHRHEEEPGQRERQRLVSPGARRRQERRRPCADPEGDVEERVEAEDADERVVRREAGATKAPVRRGDGAHSARGEHPRRPDAGEHHRGAQPKAGIGPAPPAEGSSEDRPHRHRARATCAPRQAANHVGVGLARSRRGPRRTPLHAR